MGGNPVEDVKGRAKEAAGSIAGSESLKREGKAQQDKAVHQEQAAREESRADAARERAADAEAEERANQ